MPALRFDTLTNFSKSSSQLSCYLFLTEVLAIFCLQPQLCPNWKPLTSGGPISSNYISNMVTLYFSQKVSIRGAMALLTALRTRTTLTFISNRFKGNFQQVCCIFDIGCGGSSSKNLTYFSFSGNSYPGGVCAAKMCRLVAWHCCQ